MQIIAKGNITFRWRGKIHPNGEVALSDPAWAQAISISKVQLNNQISKMEEVLAWLIPNAPHLSQPGPGPSLFWRASENAGRHMETAKSLSA